MRMSIYISLLLCSPPVGKGALSVAFVHPSDRPSVRPSVAYIANNSSTRRPSVPKFGTKIPNLWCDWHTSFKVKRSKVKVTRPINTDIHCQPYLPNGMAYELQTWCIDGGRRPASATGTMTSRSKVMVATSRDQSEPYWPNTAPVSLEAGGGILCRPNPLAKTLVKVADWLGCG